MEWQLNELHKAQYDGMLRSAQELEMTIGSTEYRIHKLLTMRGDLDNQIKKWWDEVIKEMQLDPKKDYMVTGDGQIKDVTKEAPHVTNKEDIQKTLDTPVSSL